jgi:hypothetical protein
MQLKTTNHLLRQRPLGLDIGLKLASELSTCSLLTSADHCFLVSSSSGSTELLALCAKTIRMVGRNIHLQQPFGQSDLTPNEDLLDLACSQCFCFFA